MQFLESSATMQRSLIYQQKQPLKIVVLGDSLVYGFGDPDGGGWVERLRREWMAAESSGHIIYNLGVRGDRTMQVAQRLEVEFRHRGELRNRVPDLIILSVGVNDSARVGRRLGKNYTELNRFQEQISNLLDCATQLCPVLFVGMVPVNEKKMPFLDCLYYNHDDQYIYKEIARSACCDRNIPYLDIFQQWTQHPHSWIEQRLSNDGLHPNALGYQTLLDTVKNWESISPLTLPSPAIPENYPSYCQV